MIGTDILAGVATAGLGDLLNYFGHYTKGDGMQATNAAINAQERVMDNVQTRIPSLMGILNYNAMGQTGAEAKLGANKALGAWGNSAQGMNAYNRSQQDADTLRAMATTQGNLALENSQKQSGKLVNQAISSMVAGGASPAAIAAAGGKLAGAMGDNNSQMLQGLAQSNASNISQAANIQNATNQSLLADKQMEFNKVVPYLNQRESLPGVLGNMVNAAAPVAALAGDQNKKQTGNMFGGISAMLGKAGTTLIGEGLFGDTNPKQTIATGNGIDNGKIDLMPTSPRPLETPAFAPTFSAPLSSEITYRKIWNDDPLGGKSVERYIGSDGKEYKPGSLPIGAKFIN